MLVPGTRTALLNVNHKHLGATMLKKVSTAIQLCVLLTCLWRQATVKILVKVHSETH